MVLAAFALIVSLQFWHTNQYAITPGHATSVAPLVKVTGVSTDPHHDTILLTDVYLQPLTAWQWLVAHTQSHVQFVYEDQLLEPGIPASELNAQGYLQMYDAKQSAEVAAFRSLGWKVPSRATGAVVNGVVADSPAWKAGLRVGDRVTAVDATAVDSACGLVGAVHSTSAGTTVTISYAPVHITGSGAMSWGTVTTTKLTTGTPAGGSSAQGCPGVSGPDRSYIGVTIEDSVQYTFPATVTINTANIGGPSAGLAMTLSLIDRLSEGSLTGHRTIAVTGTMSPSGVVGEVGGVAQKAVAAANAGARYFFVPVGEVADAQSTAPASLQVVGVRNLAQVLSDLHNLGGVSPKPISTPS